ncbi:MAG: DNA methylase [Lachnospiraceae bacterium]|nr:DNA methylase [Lachnospiraceae bacterium]
MNNRHYIAIDLKSFYASVECVERGLDPLTTNLVVADESRTAKTICLAVSPSLKKYGLSGRSRLFEVIARCDKVKAETGKTVEFIIAPPRMRLYMDYSSRIYNIYLEFVSSEDIHVYSIDEVFIDITDYLKFYSDREKRAVSPRELTRRIIKEVYKKTGITATAGIGTNMYLAKIAMDIVAKHEEADSEGVRIAELNELSYKELLWNHKPLTDFWRVGRGVQKRLNDNGMYTMGDVARMSVSRIGYGTGEDLLFKLFGVDAELLIDHAWGIEPCTIKDIKRYKPKVNSISSGQVLSYGYSYDKGRLIVKEMIELIVLDLVDKKLVTDLVGLDIAYDRESKDYVGEMSLDAYGRTVPKPMHATMKLKEHTSSTEIIKKAILQIFDEKVDSNLLIKKVNITLGNVKNVSKTVGDYVQLDLFADILKSKKEEKLIKEKRLQDAMLDIQGKYGKNAVLKGINLVEGATTIERNHQVGGHKA